MCSNALGRKASNADIIPLGIRRPAQGRGEKRIASLMANYLAWDGRIRDNLSNVIVCEITALHVKDNKDEGKTW